MITIINSLIRNSLIRNSLICNSLICNCIFQYITLNLLWITTLVAIAMSTFRVMNFGYVTHTYTISTLCNIVFIQDALKHINRPVITIKSFYLITCFIAAITRWYQ
jgi:hypothetical protein